MLLYLLLGGIGLYFLTKTPGLPSAASVGLGASEGDKSLITDSAMGLAYKPEMREGLLNSLLTKAVISEAQITGQANISGSAAQIVQLIEMGAVMDATRSAYYLAKLIHESPSKPSLWVTPRLTEAAKPGTPLGFLYWGNTAPTLPGTWALLVPGGEPWPGKPPIAMIPVGPGGPPTVPV